MSPVRIPENVGDFRLVDRRAVEVLRQLPERNRFMKGLFAWVGFNAIGVPYERPQRAAGSSKFNLWRLWNFALDGLVSFSTAPLRAWFYVGVVIAAVAVLYALFIITRVLIFGIDTPGYASLLIVVLLMGAIQLLSLGIIGEYLGRLFLEVKSRPIYVIEGVYEDGTSSRRHPDAVLTAWTSRKRTFWAPTSAGTGITAPRRPRCAAPSAACAAAHPRRRRGLGLLLAPSAGRDRRAIRALRRYRLRQRARRSVAGKPVLYRRDTGPTDCDLVLMMDVLEHVDDDRGLLRHYAAKVPSGAHFLVTVPAFAFLWSGHDVFLEHKRRYRLGEIEAAMRDAGLQVVRGSYYFGLVFPLAAAVRLVERNTTSPGAASRSTVRSPMASWARCARLSCRFFRSIAWPACRRSCWRRRLSRSFLEANESDQRPREPGGD